MLKTRVITALLIMPVLLIALFLFPDWGWGAFTFAIALIACWEWGRFCRLSKAMTGVYWALSLFVAAMVFFCYQSGSALGVGFKSLALVGLLLGAAFWLIAAPTWLLKLWRPQASWIIAVVGWVVVFPTWIALLCLRDVSPWLLLSFAAIVWVADIAAYFSGKALGKNKLAPAISPGKTIEGAVGGVVGVVVYFFLWLSLLANTYVGRQAWALEIREHLVMLLAFFLVLAVFSIVGDLFESWMKRGAGMKDSSNLLPGHGGILDRIDALTSTLPLAALYVLLQAKA
ncbi:MAG: phosphatidate cytidylyltransferase [Betaproteobacteria bacterium]